MSSRAPGCLRWRQTFYESSFPNMFPEAQIYHLVEAAVRETFVMLFSNLFPLASDGNLMQEERDTVQTKLNYLK